MRKISGLRLYLDISITVKTGEWGGGGVAVYMRGHRIPSTRKGARFKLLHKIAVGGNSRSVNI